MKSTILLLALMLPFTGCAALSEVDFVYFNLSGHEITVTNISGLPPEATPGVLVPVPNDTSRLNEKSSTFFERVRVADQITIFWQEDGTSHEARLQRKDLGFPSKLSGGQVRFSYLSGGKWRVRYLDKNI
jgi:hypothetical protein